MGATRHRRVAGMAIAIGLLAASCANEGQDGEGATPQGGGGPEQFADLERIEEPSPCENDPGVTDIEIKVGTIAIESGPAALSFGPALEGVEARVEKANQEGELGDRRITLVSRDDAGDPTRNAEVARDLVEQQEVFGIIEVTSTANGSAEYLNEQDVPVTGWHVGVPVWSQFPNMFTFRQGPADEPEKEFTTRNTEFLADQGATKIALIGGGNQASALFIDRVKRSIAQSDGLEVVYENVAVSTTQSDFTAEVQAIKDSGADGVYTGMDLTQNAALSDALTKAEVETKVIVFPGGYDPRVLNLPGMEGVKFGVEFYPFELGRPAFQDFDEWAPEETVRGQVPFVGWLSAEMFIQGLKEAGVGCPTREAFITNLRLLDEYDGGGAFDPVDLSEGFGEEFPCVYYVTVEAAAFVPLYDGEPFCGEPVEFE